MPDTRERCKGSGSWYGKVVRTVNRLGEEVHGRTRASDRYYLECPFCGKVLKELRYRGGSKLPYHYPPRNKTEETP